MAVAPLSQTIQLTEDGSVLALTASVTIPPDIITPPATPPGPTPGAVVALLL
ncbi:MAG TPA: hypothetical protein VF637_01065 [Sphingomicrobium sp.]|jgi:hypothetical protein